MTIAGVLSACARARLVALVLAAATVSAICALAPFAAAQGVDVHGPIHLDNNGKHIKSVALSSSDLDSYIVAYQTPDTVYSLVGSTGQLSKGQLPQAYPLIRGSVSSVAVDINSGGFAAWVVYSNISASNQCTVSAIRWNAGFEVPTTLDTLTVADTAACKLQTLSVVVSNTGEGAIVAFTYRVEANRGAAVAYSFDGHHWQKEMLCCNGTDVFALVDAKHFSFASNEVLTLISFATSNPTLTETKVYSVDFHFYEKKGELIWTFAGQAPEIATAIHGWEKSSVIAISNATDAQLFLRPHDGPFQLEHVYHAPADWDIHHPSVAFTQKLADPNAAWQYTLQIRNLTSQKIVACTQEQAWCDVIIEQKPNDEYIAVQKGALSSFFFTTGINSPQTSLTGMYGFDPSVLALESFPIQPKLAKFCQAEFRADAFSRDGGTLLGASLTGCTFEDASEGPLALAVQESFLVWATSRQVTGYTCSPQLMCVRNDSFAVFPTEGACSAGCVGPTFATGFECTTSGDCVASSHGQYPTRSYCSEQCYAIPTPSARKLSGGSILLLVVFFGMIIPYILVGSAYNKFARKAKGMEVFPHSEFWFGTMPTNIRAGWRLTKAKIFGDRASSYEAL